MKKIVLIACILFSTTSIFSQYIEITPLTGYTFTGKVDNGYGTYNVENALL